MSASCEPAPVTCKPLPASRSTRPSRPVAPITKTRMPSLFVLEFPVGGDLGMVVLQTPFVLGIVVTVDNIDQLRRLSSHPLVAGTNARAHHYFPRLIHAGAERGGYSNLQRLTARTLQPTLP